MKTDSTRLSSKGQVVIPAWVRQKLDLSPGERLKVEVGPEEERTIILRGYAADEMEKLLEKGYAWFERTGENLVEALHAARRKERAKERKKRGS